MKEWGVTVDDNGESMEETDGATQRTGWVRIGEMNVWLTENRSLKTEPLETVKAGLKNILSLSACICIRTIIPGYNNNNSSNNNL